MNADKNYSRASAVWEILIIVSILGLLAAIAIPNMGSGSHRTSPANACINNLRQIDAAANQFAYEKHLTNGDWINFPNDLTPYLKLNREGKIFSCPSGGTYEDTQQIEGSIKAPTCSLGSTVMPAHILP